MRNERIGLQADRARLGARTTVALYYAVHELDIARWFAGDIEVIHGEGNGDLLSGALRFKSGASGTIQVGWCLPDRTPGYGMAGVTVVGENGLLKVAQGDNGITIVGGDGLLDTDVAYAPDVNGKLGGMLAREVDHFVDVAMGKVPPICTAADGAAAVRAALALEASARDREVGHALMAKRVGIVGMWQETNTYSPRTTTLADFEAFELLEGEASLAHNRGTGSVIGGFLDGLGDVEAVRPFLRRRLAGRSARLRDFAPAHRPARIGAAAMRLISTACWSICTARWSRPASPTWRPRRCGACGHAIRVSRSWRCLTSTPISRPKLAPYCDAVVGYRTYPHVDMADCGRETAGLMRRALNGERFVTAYAKLGVLTTPLAQGTAVEPMRGLIARAEARAADAGVDRVSLLPGFPYSDVERCGFSILAVATLSTVGRCAACGGAKPSTDVERKLPDFVVKRPKAR